MASLQLPAKYPQLPTLPLGQTETLICHIYGSLSSLVDGRVA